MRYVKNIVLIFTLFLSSFCFAQNSTTVVSKSQAYTDLMNYVPKSLKLDLTDQPESQLLRPKTKNILGLWMSSELKIGKKDQQWLDRRIHLIATALYQDGKRILIRTVGGYLGCPDKSVDTLRLNNIEISDLQLCRSCTEFHKDKNFIKAFNQRMYDLMNIDPPTEKTRLFYGDFKGLDENKFQIKLTLKEDRTFQFWRYKGHGSDYTEGIWKHENDILLLHSKNLNNKDSLAYALSSGKWIEFKDLKMQLKRDRLKTLNEKKWKLKKRTKRSIR